MKVYIPDALRSYTADLRTVSAKGATLAALLVDLDRQFPGIRFRMVDEQDSIRRKVTFISRYLKIVGIVWGVLLLLIAGLWVAQGLNLV